MPKTYAAAIRELPTLRIMMERELNREVVDYAPPGDDERRLLEVRAYLCTRELRNRPALVLFTDRHL